MKTNIQTIHYANSIKRLTPIFAGLLTAQIIATAYVYRSNQHILAMVHAIEKAGYNPIPTGPAIAMLERFEVSFWAGIFFTLSIGVGLTILTWTAIHLWHLGFQRNRLILIVYGLLYTGLAILLNLKDIYFFPLLFYLLVPLITAWITFKTLPIPPGDRNYRWLAPVTVLIALTALWATQLNQNLFITIRDHVLLSNPVGQSVNDFYYRYTLFAAETFKSFHQKTLRTCQVKGIETPAVLSQWEQRLAKQDILILPEFDQPDVVLFFSPNQITFVHSNGDRFNSSLREFVANPEKTIKAFSKSTDRLSSFRKITLFGLLVGFPIFLFILVYNILQMAVGWILKPHKITYTVSLMCLFIGILLFLPMRHTKPFEIVPGKIETALNANQWFFRVAALQYIESHGLEISQYPSYQKLLDSPRIVERYWIARALAKSRTKSTYHQLLMLLEDSHPNVVCQTFYALGIRGCKDAIGPIKHKMNMTDHWYVQWYGYNALRNLGWRQTPLN